jgi:TolA-binding protein
MNENLKSKLVAKLDALSDDVGRQVLDYVEFLESKFNRSRRAPSTVQRLAENIEDRIGSVKLADVAVKGGAQILEAAGKLMEGLAAASRVVAEELEPTTPAAGNGQPSAAEPAKATQAPPAADANHAPPDPGEDAEPA